ncbi:MAG: serine aminopeptidase domain-containing protein [Vicinamibacterales bacterium]
MRMRYGVLALAPVVLAAALLAAAYELPEAGAAALLHPIRRSLAGPTPASCTETVFQGGGVALNGWRCAAGAPPKATIVYLHGVADNHFSAAGVVDRFVPQGFDVIAYDSRAHGRSGGDACPYGYFEKEDLRRVVPGAAHNQSLRGNIWSTIERWICDHIS